MVCKRCQGQARSERTQRRPDERCRLRTCHRCGTAILTLAGVVVGTGDETLAVLARFGLASTAKPLLEPTHEGT